MFSLPDRTIPFREALRFRLKLGFISVGGPAGQFALMHAGLVESTHDGDIKLCSPLTGIAAALALQRFKRSVLEVIAACAVTGRLLKLLTP